MFFKQLKAGDMYFRVKIAYAISRKAFAVVFSCSHPLELLGCIDFEQKKCYFYDLECFFHHFACFLSNERAVTWIFG